MDRPSESLKATGLGLMPTIEPLQYGGLLENFDENIINIIAFGDKAFLCNVQWGKDPSDVSEEWIPKSQARIDSKDRIWLSEWIIGKKRQQDLDLKPKE